MKTIKHKFIDYKINPETETLIIGTFNPASEDNPAEFFYGRSRNYLWRLLPGAFNHKDLKQASINEKKEFITNRKIDFIDLIAQVESQNEGKTRYYDGTLDKSEISWQDVIGEIDKLKHLKRVCFTRKTFSDIPKMRVQIEKIREHCINKGIEFTYLTTPARYYNLEKQREWSDFFVDSHK